MLINFFAQIRKKSSTIVHTIGQLEIVLELASMTLQRSYVIPEIEFVTELVDTTLTREYTAGTVESTLELTETAVAGAAPRVYQVVSIPTTTAYGDVYAKEYIPPGYQAGDPVQVVMFFHGAGERGPADGSQINKVDVNGIPKMIAAGNDFPFVMIAYQTRNTLNSTPAYIHKYLLDWLYARYNVAEVIYTGLSMGGGGCWNAVGENDGGNVANRIDKVIPVAGHQSYTGDAKAQNFVDNNIPVWAIHSDSDGQTPYSYSTSWVDGINGLGGDAVLTTLTSGQSHAATWQEVYENNLNNGFYAYLRGEGGRTLDPPSTPAAPTDISLSANSINENATGKVADISSNGYPASTFAITGGTDQADFSIQNGDELHLDNAKSYESVTSLQVQITATNSEGSFAETFTVNINNVSEITTPTNLSLDSNSILEGNSIGDLIGNLSSDGLPSPSFSLVSGTGSTDNSSFTISGSQLLAGEVFDESVKSSYSIRVRVSVSNGGESGQFEQQFTINITASNVAPTDISLSNNSIDENTTGLIGTISADGDPAPTFAITGGADQAEFSIQNGNELHLDNAQDYESVTSLQVQITATNAAGSFAETFTVNINDVAEGGPTLLQTVQVDLAGGASGYSSGWHRVSTNPTVTPANISSLQNSSNQASGIGFNSGPTGPWLGFAAWGEQTGNNSGVYPDFVIQYAWGTDLDNSEALPYFFNLNPARRYTIECFGSDGTNNGAADIPTDFTINGVTKTLITENNNQNIVTFDLVEPNGSNQIVIGIKRGAGSNRNGIVNAFRILEYQV